MAEQSGRQKDLEQPVSLPEQEGGRKRERGRLQLSASRDTKDGDRFAAAATPAVVDVDDWNRSRVSFHSLTLSLLAFCDCCSLAAVVAVWQNSRPELLEQPAKETEDRTHASAARILPSSSSSFPFPFPFSCKLPPLKTLRTESAVPAAAVVVAVACCRSKITRRRSCGCTSCRSRKNDKTRGPRCQLLSLSSHFPSP